MAGQQQEVSLCLCLPLCIFLSFCLSVSLSPSLSPSLSLSVSPGMSRLEATTMDSSHAASKRPHAAWKRPHAPGVSSGDIAALLTANCVSKQIAAMFTWMAMSTGSRRSVQAYTANGSSPASIRSPAYCALRARMHA